MYSPHYDRIARQYGLEKYKFIMNHTTDDYSRTNYKQSGQNE